MSDDTPAAPPSMPTVDLDTILFHLGIGEEENLESSEPPHSPTSETPHSPTYEPPHSPTYEPHSPTYEPPHSPPPSHSPSPPPPPPKDTDRASHQSTKELLIKNYARPPPPSSSSPSMTTPPSTPCCSREAMMERHREAKRVLKRKPIRPPQEHVAAKRWKKQQEDRHASQERRHASQGDRHASQERRHASKEHHREEETTRRHETRRRPFPKRTRQRQVYYHTQGYVVLAANGTGGYTLSNGVVSICEDYNDDWIENMLKDLQSCFKVTRLFVVDEVSRTQWIKAKQYLKDDNKIKQLDDVLLDNKSTILGLCTFCKNFTCHRWKAIVGGVQRLLQFPIEAIRH